MGSHLEIRFEEKASTEDLAALRRGLQEHGRSAVGESWIKDLAFFLRDENGEVRGGVFGNCGSFGWMYVDTLWVDERLRGQGYGSRLMSMIEAEAVGRGSRYAYLSTFSFQAPDFYEKIGYREFARLEQFPAEQSRVFFRKDLVAE